jgi:hypothetical protein
VRPPAQGDVESNQWEGLTDYIILAVCDVFLLALLMVWWRSYRVSHEFCHYSRRSGVIFTVSKGQFRLYRNWPQELNDRTGFVHRVWRFAPTFDVNRSPMDQAYCRWGSFSYARGENDKTHTRYRLASIPIWFPILVLITTAVIATS